MIRVLVFSFLVGFTYGDLQLWTVSQASYAAKVGALITEAYNDLVAETEEFKPEAEACAAKVNATSDKCQACLAKVECGSSSGALAFLEQLKVLSPTVWGPKLEDELSNIANKIAEGAETIYKKYGAPAINAISDGLSAIGNTFKNIGNVIGKGLTIAFNAVKDAFESLFNKFKDLFGKRRKRSSMMAEASVVREKRANSAEAQACMAKCSDCSPLSSGVQETSTREICGDAVVDKQTVLESAATKLESFFKDYESATDNLIGKVYIETTTGKVSSVSVMKGGVYVTYNCESANIVFNAFNQDPTYQAIAEFIYSQY